MKALRYEKVGDISSKYSFLEVYFDNRDELFMEIGITDNKELCFKIYPAKSSIELTVENWADILKTAKAFLLEAIKDEEDFDSFMK
ncbi:MAG: hypothetical protein ACK5H1_07780 [Tenacibaculum sp.]